MKVYLLITVLTFVAMATAVSNVRKCSSAKKSDDADINISKCDKPPCLLKRKTTIDVEYKIKPDTDVKNLTNTVFARIAGIPLPFIGVDYTNACGQVYNAQGEKVGCPLKAGEEYIYKNVIKVMQIYPKVSLDVHWALTAPGNKDIFCFEVPARITS